MTIQAINRGTENFEIQILSGDEAALSSDPTIVAIINIFRNDPNWPPIPVGDGREFTYLSDRGELSIKVPVTVAPLASVEGNSIASSAVASQIVETTPSSLHTAAVTTLAESSLVIASAVSSVSGGAAGATTVGGGSSQAGVVERSSVNDFYWFSTNDGWKMKALKVATWVATILTLGLLYPVLWGVHRVCGR